MPLIYSKSQKKNDIFSDKLRPVIWRYHWDILWIIDHPDRLAARKLHPLVVAAKQNIFVCIVSGSFGSKAVFRRAFQNCAGHHKWSLRHWHQKCCTKINFFNDSTLLAKCAFHLNLCYIKLVALDWCACCVATTTTTTSTRDVFLFNVTPWTGEGEEEEEKKTEWAILQFAVNAGSNKIVNTKFCDSNKRRRVAGCKVSIQRVRIFRISIFSSPWNDRMDGSHLNIFNYAKEKQCVIFSEIAYICGWNIYSI